MGLALLTNYGGQVGSGGLGSNLVCLVNTFLVEIIISLFFSINFRALQFPPEAWLRLNVAHASITQLVCHPTGTVVLDVLGGSEHMPPNMITF